MKVVAIIQARMRSTRLPGKVLRDLAGESMLGRVVRRVRRAPSIDEVIVAVPDTPADEPLVRHCRRLDAICFRGSEHDVLDRFWRAAEANRADAVVRLTADCPLIDPEVTDRVVRAFLDALPDYCSNTLERTWPRGLDTEVVTSGALACAWREARETYQRTHVMPYLYQHPERFRLLAVTAGEDHGRDRWTVDTPDDLAFAEAVYERMGGDDRFSWRDVQRLLSEEPWLTDLNHHVRQKHLAEG
jgi:spore coat polysaccharide biosynthesis protein SpsF